MTKPTPVHDTGNPQAAGRDPFLPPAETEQTGPRPQAPADQTGYLPYPESGQNQPQYGQPQYGQNQYGQPPYPYSPAPVGETSGVRTLWILGFVLGAIGLLFPLAGIAGIVCGAMAWSKGSRRGMPATLVAIAGTVIGLAIGIAFYM